MKRAASSERGSALVLMPVGLLILLMLAGLAVDYSRAFMAQRELANAAAAAANDAASMLVEESFYGDGDPRLDAELSDRVADSARAARAASPDVVTVTRFDTTASADAVDVIAEGYVNTIFFRAFPWGPRRIHVRARSSATAWELTP